MKKVVIMALLYVTTAVATPVLEEPPNEGLVLVDRAKMELLMKELQRLRLENDELLEQQDKVIRLLKGWQTSTNCS